MSDSARLERMLARQSVMHYRKRDEQLERVLAHAIAAARPKCKCAACRMLRDLRDELGGCR